MQFNEYQEKALKTAKYPDVGNNFIYPTLALSDEAGEVAGKIKKFIRDQHKFTPADLDDEDRAVLKKEIGDVLWYLAVLSQEVGLSFEEVAEGNLEKLQSRSERGTIHGSGDDR